MVGDSGDGWGCTGALELAMGEWAYSSCIYMEEQVWWRKGSGAGWVGMHQGCKDGRGTA